MYKLDGTQIIVDLYNVSSDKLNNIDFITKLFVDACLNSGAEVREVCFHKFAPHRVSGVVILSESHAAIHTYPEHGFASLDCYTCGETVDPEDIIKYIVDELKCFASPIHYIYHPIELETL